jgi:ribosomal protein S18 acetylase RimI-like enzyme
MTQTATSLATMTDESTFASVQIRPMELTDYDDVLALWRGTNGLGGVDTRQEIDRYLARNPGFSQVAIVDGQVVGALLCGHDGRRGYIYRLAVAREHRRQGIGQRLVETCLELLRMVDISHVTIFILHDNTPAELFWKDLGWVERTDLKTFAKYL